MLPRRLLCLFTSIVPSLAHPHRPLKCPPVSGNLVVPVRDLYPESAAWNPTTCRLYLSSTYNVSLVRFDPYSNTSEVLSIPGLTNAGAFNFTEYHLNGVDYDASSDLIYVAAGAATAFTSTDTGDYSNANYTGDNRILRLNATSAELLADINLSSVQQVYLSKYGHRTSGFQDMAEDESGNSYAIGTFGNSIAKIPKGSKSATLWYGPGQYNETYGFGGIFAIQNKLVISDRLSGGLVTFDTTQTPPQPKSVPLQGLPSWYRPGTADGLYAPPKYNGRVALWSDDYNGTSVYGSNDTWRTAHYLGFIPNDARAVAEGGLAVGTVDVAGSIYSINEYFQLNLPMKDRSSFPLYDITAGVEEIVQNSALKFRSERWQLASASTADELQRRGVGKEQHCCHEKYRSGIAALDSHQIQRETARHTTS